jgi:alanine racemase
MGTSRRAFLSTSAAMAASAGLPYAAPASSLREPLAGSARPHTFDPWLEVVGSAVRANARAVAELAGGRPMWAVVKNNAYGLGLAPIGRVLDGAPEVAGFAVVKTDEAVALRDAGVRKPILLLGLVGAEEAIELVQRDVLLAPFTDDAPAMLGQIARQVGAPVRVHLYVDTGMGRLGMPYHRANAWIESLASSPDIGIEGAFTTFTEDETFDVEQLARFSALIEQVKSKGISVGRLHAASSHALFFRPAAYLDMVRPGLALYGAYPAGADQSKAALTPAFRLRVRVVRVERLRAGDSVSYGRNYVAERPTWIATLPVGHADGYPRRAVHGCVVLAGGRTYRVIGAVSASHTIIEVGDEPAVARGDEVTLVGPDHPAIHPNTVAERTGASVYDVLMHLSARLPVRIL